MTIQPLMTSTEMQAWFENEMREHPLRKFQVWIDGTQHTGDATLRSGLLMYYVHVEILHTTQTVELRADGTTVLKESGRCPPNTYDCLERCAHELEQIRDPSKWVAFAASVLMGTQHESSMNVLRS